MTNVLNFNEQKAKMSKKRKNEKLEKIHSDVVRYAFEYSDKPMDYFKGDGSELLKETFDEDEQDFINMFVDLMYDYNVKNLKLEETPITFGFNGPLVTINDVVEFVDRKVKI